MALFNVSVLATLNVPREVRDVLARLVTATERQAVALEAIVAKLNEPDPPAVPGELHDAIGEQAQTATEVREAIRNPGQSA